MYLPGDEFKAFLEKDSARIDKIATELGLKK